MVELTDDHFVLSQEFINLILIYLRLSKLVIIKHFIVGKEIFGDESLEKVGKSQHRLSALLVSVSLLAGVGDLV